MSSQSFVFKVTNGVRVAYRYHGVWFPFVLCQRSWIYLSRKIFNSRTFVFADTAFHYHIHPYSLDNERTVEVALALDFLRGKSGRGLEVGNVLSYYTPLPHDIVDKYEQSPGVINEDIVTYAPGKKYDWIVTVSTLEHVGFDEQPREPEKIVTAIERLKELLDEQGQMLITMPLGYNPYVDKMFIDSKMDLGEVRFLLRESADNQWRQASLDEVVGARYGAPFPCANAVVVALFSRHAS